MDKQRDQIKGVRSDGQEKDQTDKADEEMGQNQKWMLCITLPEEK